MRSRTLIIVVGVIVAIVGLAAIALLVSGGDEDSGGVLAPGETVRPTYGPDVKENRPVEVAGDPLPSFDKAVATDPAIGMAAPVITGSTFDGNPITVGGPTNGPTMYVFLAHWCPHCNDEIPSLIEVQARGGIPQGLNVVGISTGVDKGGPNYPPSKWIVNKEWPWPVMADDANSSAYSASSGGAGFPYVMIVDADGNVLARDSGQRSPEDLAKWIKQSLVGQPTA